MGSMCEKQQSPLKPNKHKCSKCSKTPSNSALIRFPTCAHSVCETCLKQFPTFHTKCPLEHKSSSAQLKQLRKVKAGRMCSQNHRMVWGEQRQVCGVCSSSWHGFKCGTCQQFVCLKCSQYDFSGGKCPNDHNTVWVSGGVVCVICGDRSHGMSCKQCKWQACSSCSKIDFSTCPNSHKLTWLNNRSLCTICKQHSQKTFTCKECNLFICMSCSSYQYDRQKCPNNHPTQLTQKNNCSRCGIDMAGRSCQKCSYHFCTKCDLEKYSSTNRKQIEAIQSIKLTENPLLKIKNKSPEPAIKTSWTQQAINKLNQKHQTLSNIRINQTIAPARTTEQIREQIEENPGRIELYLALANLYKQNKLFTNQITVYEQAWEIEEEKGKVDQMVLLSLGKRGLQRSLELNFKKYAVNYLTKLIRLAEEYPNKQQIAAEAEAWRLSRVEQYIILKEFPKAELELSKLEAGGEEYRRVKAMMPRGKR